MQLRESFTAIGIRHHLPRRHPVPRTNPPQPLPTPHPEYRQERRPGHGEAMRRQPLGADPAAKRRTRQVSGLRYQSWIRSPQRKTPAAHQYILWHAKPLVGKGRWQPRLLGRHWGQAGRGPRRKRLPANGATLRRTKCISVLQVRFLGQPTRPLGGGDQNGFARRGHRPM